MNVFVTGGNGFVGVEILKQLKEAGHQARALVRPNSPHGTEAVPDGVEVVQGDVLDEDLEKHLDGMEAVIHLVGIIRSYPSKGILFQKAHVDAALNVIRAMKSKGVKRLVHMSALGANPGWVTEYFRTKWEAANAVADSGLSWTIIKPSIVYGPMDEFVNMLAGQVRTYPMVPVIGDGKYMLQPIHVRDVAKGFVKALAMDQTVGQTFEAGGPEEITYNQVLDEIARAMGEEKAKKVHLPLPLMQAGIRIMESFEFFPVTMDQLKMLLMNNVCDPEPFFKTFDIQPIKFSEGIREYMKG